MKTRLLRMPSRLKVVITRDVKPLLLLLLMGSGLASSIRSQLHVAAVSAATTTIRHEINILDGVLTAVSGAAADSNEIVQLDATKYGSPSYYFEVVAGASANCSFTALLRRKGAAIDDASITVAATPTYNLFRSSTFAPPSGQTEYVARISTEGGCTKSLKAARIVVVDSDPTYSETQIEIGNNESVTGVSPSPLGKPKYWKYSAADWNGSHQFFIEVTYSVSSGVGSQTYGSNSVFTAPFGVTSVTAEAWGGGATGSKGPSQKARGGGGGGGGAYAKRHAILVTPGNAYDVFVAASVPGGAGVEANGNASSFSGDNGMVSAAGGLASSGSTGGAGGAASSSNGDIIFAGGAGGNSAATNNSGGAGGGSSAGINASGNAGSPASNGTGSPGGAAPTGGAAGGHGGNASSNSGITDGFSPGGGGGGAGGGTDITGGGARGQVQLTWAFAVYIGLFEDDGALRGWKEKTIIIPAGQSTSPSRVRVPFTPVDGRTYRIQIAQSDSIAQAWIYNAKIVADLGIEGTVDNYSELNLNRTSGVWLGSFYYPTGAAQSFTGDGGRLKSVKFFIKKYANSSGFAWARIYATTGVFGADSAPTGAALATSTALDVSTLSSTNYALREFTFTGPNQVTLQTGIHYAVAVEYSSPAGDAIIDLGVHNSGSTGHEGNLALRPYSGSGYVGASDRDLIFYVNSVPSAFSKLEEQYLLANTQLTGSNLQQSMGRWDPAEWSNVNNTYKHQVDSGAGSSVVELNSGSVQLEGSRITADRVITTSEPLVMPASSNLDVSAVTNNGDVYGSRIDVRASVILPPQITSIAPAFGSAGTVVAISGSGFGPAQQNSTVTFNGLAAPMSSWSDTAIQTSAPPGVTTGYVVVTVNGVNSNGVVFTVAPTITALSPTSGPIGSVVTISGNNFGVSQGSSTVKFNGVTASVSSWSASTIIASVPTNGSSGSVTVTVAGLSSNALTFLVSGPLSITGIAPNPARTGALVTITGINFGALQGASTVTFNGVTASPASWSDSSITVPVPTDATTGPVVINISGAQSNSYAFTTIPYITTISPNTGGPNTFVKISGTAFGAVRGSSTITFNGTAASPSVWSNTSIVVPPPANATTGPVVVAVNGQASNQVTFSFSNVGSISGIVRRALDGTGVAGVVVQASQAGALVAGMTTAPDGSYASPSLTPGTYDIAAYVDGYLPVVAAGNLVSANQTTIVPISLKKPSIASLDPAAGVAGTTVTLRGSDFGSVQGMSRISFNGAAAGVLSWSDGIIIAVAPPGASTGPVTVIVQGIESNAAPFAVGTGTIQGLVSDADSGAAIPGALIELLQANTAKASGVTDADGRYTVADIAPGFYDVRISSDERGTLVNPAIPVTVGATAVLNAALSTSGIISGKVTKSDGTTPIAGATVNVVSQNVVFATTFTNDAGDYSCSCIGTGSYSVQAAAPGYTPQTRNRVDVSSGTAATIDFNLSGESVISYSYDSLGRLTGVSDSLGDAAAYTYDAVGNVVSIIRSASSETFISGFTPTQGAVGTIVRINGTGFNSTPSLNTVRFNGTAAVVGEADPTELLVSVPEGAVSGPITVTSTAGSATSSSAFAVTAQSDQPVITSLNPTLGQAAASVTIAGINFDPTPSNNRVMLNTTFIAPSSVTPAAITLTIPANVGSGRFRVVTPKGEAASSDFFVIPSGYAVSQLAYTGRTAIRGVTHVAIDAAGGIGILLFDGVAGQPVSISTANSTVSSCNVAISLLGPTAATLASNSCMGNGFLGAHVLPADGTYALLIATTSTVSGSLDVALNDATAVTEAITPGGSAPVTISTPGQLAELVFNGAPGQRISVQTSSSTFSSCVSILNPDQTTLASAACAANAFIDRVTLEWSGVYTLYITGSGGSTGTLTVRLYDIPADINTPIVRGGPPVSLNITTPGQNAKLTFSGIAGQRISVQTSGVSIAGSWIAIQQDANLLPFTAGQQYNIAMEYFQAAQGSIAKLKWSSPSTHFGLKQIIPQSQMTPPGGMPGPGLQGQYYSNSGISGSPTVTRIDHSIDFNWHGESPGGAVPSSNWSARWTGQITAQFSEQYSFCTETDDGVRLWIDGKMIVDKWQTQGATEWCYNTPTILAVQHQTGPGYIDTIQLPVTGTYTISIDPDAAAIGYVTLVVNDVPADASAAITPGGGPVTVDIAAPGQNARVTFSGTAGQRVSLQTSGAIAGSWITIQQEPRLLQLAAGQPYSVVMEYFQATQGSVARLKWISPSNVNQPIPQTQLKPAAGVLGDGLQGEYYNNQTLSGSPILTRIDPTVDFNWSGSTPGGGIPGSFWSARWTGQIVPPLSEQYTFCTETDDGARLWVNGMLVVDKWQTQGATEWCGNTPSVLAAQHQTGGGFIDTIQLPVSGAYSILIDPDAAATGSITVTLNDVPANPFSTITPNGSPVDLTIDTPGQAARLSFTGTAGQRITVQTSAASLGGNTVTIQQDPTQLLAAPGQDLTIEMQYFQAGQGSVAKLKWGSPSTLRQVIPQSQLTPPGGMAGAGLQGEYYGNQTLSGAAALTRVDPTIDFSWGGSTPGTGLPGAFWSARWIGQIQAQYSEQYTLCTETDDGARLWVNGSLVLDHWVTQGATEWCYNAPTNIKSQHFTGSGSITGLTLPATGSYTIIIDPDASSTGSITVALTTP